MRSFVEALEGRQFFSVSTAAIGLLHDGPQVAARVAILGPAAVEGTYKGTISGSDGVTFQIKLTLTSNSAKLVVEGLGTYTSKLSSSQFKLIREGKFKVDFKNSKGGVTCTGTVTKSGERISGTYVNTLHHTGTFVLKK